MIGYPRIVGFDRAAEWLKERREGAGQISEADEADARAIERKAALGAIEQPLLAPRPHRPIGCGYAATEVDRKAKSHFGNGAREGRARGEHMDSAYEAGLVIDVLQKVGFDVDDGAQLRGAVEPGLRHVALADEKLHFREKGFKPLRRHAACALHGEFAEALEPAPRGPVENLAERARLRIDHDQRSRHSVPPFRQ